jgi:hypothetical protein
MRAKTAAGPGKSETAESSPSRETPSRKTMSRETLYRMKWLSAHNYLHALVHDPSSRPAIVWDQYLDELQWADELLKSPDQET